MVIKARDCSEMFRIVPLLAPNPASPLLSGRPFVIIIIIGIFFYFSFSSSSLPIPQYHKSGRAGVSG